MSSTDTPDDSHKVMLDPVGDHHKVMLDPVGDHHKVMLDRLCAAYPRMEREVLDIAMYAHEAWEREIGANYDVHTAGASSAGNGEGITPAEAPDASSDPVPA
jgi:hypothetical protein